MLRRLSDLHCHALGAVQSSWAIIMMRHQLAPGPWVTAGRSRSVRFMQSVTISLADMPDHAPEAKGRTTMLEKKECRLRPDRRCRPD